MIHELNTPGCCVHLASRTVGEVIVGLCQPVGPVAS